MSDPRAVPTEQRWPIASQLFLHDVARCLALAHQGELQLDTQGRLLPGSLQRLAQVVSLPVPPADVRTEAQAPALSFLVGLLGAAGFVGAVDGTLRLAEAGSHWFGAPPAFQVRQLRDAWWLNPEANTRWLPPTRHQWSPRARWQRIVLDTAIWVASLSHGTWTPTEALIHHLAASGLLSSGERGNLPRVHEAAQSRLVALARFLLRVPFPCLGLADTREHDGELHVRPLTHGTAWLQAAVERAHLLAHPPAEGGIELAVPAEVPRFPPADTPAVTVALNQDGGEPGLLISIRPHAAALCTFELMHLAHLRPADTAPEVQGSACRVPSAGVQGSVTGEPIARYRLTRASLSRALTWGYSVADVLFLLDRFAGGDPPGVPPDAAAQLRAWGEEMALITWQAGFRLTTATPDVLAALRRREPFRRRTAPLASAADAWVSRAESPALWTYLRRVGYELQLPGDLNDWPLDPRLHTPLPLAQLLAILRTYEELRRLVPGLSVLHCGELERSLAGSLPEAGTLWVLAGVDRLVQSHVVLIKHCLKRRPSPEAGQGSEPDAGPKPEEHDRPPVAEAAEHSSARATEPPGRAERSGAAVADLEARLAAAIHARAEVDLTYADTDGQVTHRRVRPIHLEQRWGRDYLLAHCYLRGDERHFRLDRIIAVADGE